jgi:hypothetical protein
MLASRAAGVGPALAAISDDGGLALRLDAGHVWLHAHCLEDSWLDGRAAPICPFITAGFQHGSASAWHGLAR